MELTFTLIIQILIAVYSTFKSIYIIILFIYNKNKYIKIKIDDDNKFDYFRELLNDISIAQIGYLYDEDNKIERLIYSSIEYLKMNKQIDIVDNNINITSDNFKFQDNKYLANHYKFRDFKEFRVKYLNDIRYELQKNGYLKKKKFKFPIEIILILFLYIISIISLANSNNNNTDFINLLILLNFFIIFISAFIITIISNLVVFNKTDKGREITLKIKGLKNYIRDFGNFDDKKIEEINLWGEYILYAIVLDESDKLSSELKLEYENLKKYN